MLFSGCFSLANQSTSEWDTGEEENRLEKGVRGSKPFKISAFDLRNNEFGLTSYLFGGWPNEVGQVTLTRSRLGTSV